MKLKLNLLIPILENTPSASKYSKAFLNLKNVFRLEERNNYTFEDPLVYEEFKQLEKKYNNFISNIPLVVIERYFNDKKEDVNKHAFLIYQENELSEIRIMELFKMLEDFYADCFQLASIIADLYNIEVKLNKHKSKESEESQEFF